LLRRRGARRPITRINGGFRLRAHTTHGVSGHGVSGQQRKHVSVALDATHVPADVDQ